MAAVLLFNGPGALAQERVEGARDPDALFHSADPGLDANKQVAYHIVRDILEADDIESVNKYLTERYIQHNPNIPSGRAELRRSLGLRTPKPIGEKLGARVVSVVAEGDYVVVGVVYTSSPTRRIPASPTQRHTSTCGA